MAPFASQIRDRTFPLRYLTPNRTFAESSLVYRDRRRISLNHSAPLRHQNARQRLGRAETPTHFYEGCPPSAPGCQGTTAESAVSLRLNGSFWQMRLPAKE